MTQQTDNKVKVKVTTELWKNADGKHLNVVTEFAGQVSKKVIALEEQATIDALKRLGWKPPDDGISQTDNAALKCLHSDIHAQLSLLDKGGNTKEVAGLVVQLFQAALTSQSELVERLEKAKRRPPKEPG